MILQTGQRTDIPAFYGQWLINRINEGFVDVRNPYNPNLITRYMINHNTIDGIAFCTKNPLPFIQIFTSNFRVSSILAYDDHTLWYGH